MQRMFFVLVFLCISALCCIGCSSSNEVMPLNKEALAKLKKNEGSARFDSIAANCDKQNQSACLLELAKESERVFSSSGYSYDKSIANCYSSMENAIFCEQSGVGNFFKSAFMLMATKEGKELLLKEGLVSADTIKIVENAEQLFSE